MFLSHQRGDLVNLSYPRAWDTRFASENLQSSVPRKSVIVEAFWGHPGLTQRCSRALQTLLGSPGLLLAAASCSRLLLVGRRHFRRWADDFANQAAEAESAPLLI